jgi:glutamate dehydrogenase
LLIQLEKALADMCRWATFHGSSVRPEENIIDNYRAYLKDYASYIAQNKTDISEALFNQYQQNQVPSELAQKLIFIANIQDFPFIVSLTTETGKNIVTILTLLGEINSILGLNAIRQQLIDIPLRDNWERKVAFDLQEDLQRISGQLLKHILSSQLTCPDYFGQQIGQRQIKDYGRMRLEIENALPLNLLPYICLLKALKKLVDGIHFVY